MERACGLGKQNGEKDTRTSKGKENDSLKSIKEIKVYCKEIGKDQRE
jgi:hypothetical protein